MLIKTGIAVSDMSGSSGGITAARNRFGLYLRSRTTPVNPKSDRQVAARAIMAFLAEQWRESPMTSVIREAWATYAASFNWDNKLGEAVNLTGFNAFCMCNAAMLSVGGTLVTAAPTTLGLPAQDPAFAVTISAATQKLSVTFDDGFDWVDEDNAWLSVQMGQPQSPSRNFFGGPWRLAGGIEGDSITPPTTPDATLDCPFTAIEAQVCWCQARIIRDDARTSSPFRAARIVIAA